MIPRTVSRFDRSVVRKVDRPANCVYGNHVERNALAYRHNDGIEIPGHTRHLIPDHKRVLLSKMGVGSR